LLSALRDASNLSWKLDLVMGGRAPESILDTYESERRPHAAAWTQISLAEGRVSAELDPIRAAERDARMLGGQKLDIPHFPCLGDGCFQGGRAVDQGLIGSLGLQGRIGTAQGVGRFDDMMGARRFSVLVLGADPYRQLSEAQVTGLKRLGAVLCEVAPPDAEAAAGRVIDIECRYQRYFKEHGIVAVVNRPDFHVFGGASELAGLSPLIDELFQRLGMEP
jgi:hypothetical protein